MSQSTTDPVYMDTTLPAAVWQCTLDGRRPGGARARPDGGLSSPEDGFPQRGGPRLEVSLHPHDALLLAQMEAPEKNRLANHPEPPFRRWLISHVYPPGSANVIVRITQGRSVGPSITLTAI